MEILIETNADDVMGKVERALDDFGFHTDNLGERLVAQGAASISARGLQEHRGADRGWDPNAPEYARWKGRHYGTTDPNVRTGQMLSLESVTGESQIDDQEVRWPYGKGTAPASKNPHDTLTDREKAHWAHVGQSDKHVIRAFFELTEEDMTEVQTMTGETLADHLREKLS